MPFNQFLLLITIFIKIVTLTILLLSIVPTVFSEMRKTDMIFAIRMGLFIFILDYVVSIILSLFEDIFHFSLPNHPIQIIFVTFLRAISFLIGTVVLYYIYHLHYKNGGSDKT